MDENRLSLKPLKCLTLASLLSACIFTSSAQAVIVAEAHACRADSETGGWWSGDYYFPGARTARTYLYEWTPEPMDMTVNLWAYPEGGSTYVFKSGHVQVPAGGWYDYTGVAVVDPETAPGHLLSYHMAWTPTMTRGQTGFYTAPGEAVDANGCVNRVEYL